MGNAISGPNSFKFFGFTTQATASLHENPGLFFILISSIVLNISIGLLAYWIHVVTNRVYKKPKEAKAKDAPKK